MSTRQTTARVYVTRHLPEAVIRKLQRAKAVREVRVNPYDRVATRRELEKGVQWCDCLLCLLTDRIDAEVMDWNPHLRIIANNAAGFDNIDVSSATQRGIPVTNTPGVLTETTADFARALLMACARRVVESDVWMRSGKFKGWSPLLYLGHDIFGKTLGIVGFGRIGYAVARRARGFDMRVLYTDVQRVDERVEKSVNAEFVALRTLLRESDFVSLHLPLNSTTTHLIGRRELRQMKETAFLVNTSRGPVMDEGALVEASRKGWIAGAGLDVYEKEPEMFAGLANCSNVIVAPHIASATIETRTAMGMIAVSNILARVQGKRPPTIVNPEVLEVEGG